VDTLSTARQASELSQLLRSSVWLYPLINTAHLVGIALLFGAIVPLDLRLLGWFGHAPTPLLASVLLPVSVTGLGLALLTGSLLFATRPLDYVVEPLMGIKLALLCLAVVNALWLRRRPDWRRADAEQGAPLPPGWRMHAALSILFWLGVIAAGRLIGYR
jgi:tellurite resistance protein TehA-like permease